MNKHNLKVGQIIFVEHSYTRNETLAEYEVAKIGRKWAELKRPGDSKYIVGRIDLETLEWDGRHHRVWLSLEERKNILEKSAAWTDFCRAISNVRSCPKHLSKEDIERARSILKL